MSYICDTILLIPVSYTHLDVYKRQPINNVYFAAGALFVSSGFDTSIKLDIISDPESERPAIEFETPTFLVSNDDEVSQFCYVSDDESNREVLEIGKNNFCALYNLSNP